MRKKRKGVIALSAVLIFTMLLPMVAFAAPTTDGQDFIQKVTNIPIGATLTEDAVDRASAMVTEAKTAFAALGVDDQSDASVVAAKAELDKKEEIINKAINVKSTSTERTDMFPVTKVTFSYNNTWNSLTIEDPTTKKVTIFKDRPVEFISLYKSSVDMSDATTYADVVDIPFKHSVGAYGYEFPDITNVYDTLAVQKWYVDNGLTGPTDPKLDKTDPAYDNTLVAPLTLGRPLNGWQLQSVMINGEEYEPTDTIMPNILADAERGYELQYNYVPSYTYTIMYDFDGGSSTTYKNTTASSILANDKMEVTISKNADGSFRNPPTKTGFTFKGFTLDGETTLRTDTFTLNMTAGNPRTLKAVWEPVVVPKWTAKISYDASVGTNSYVGEEEKEVPETDASTTMTVPEKKADWTPDGYTFKGWTYTKGATTATVTPGSNLTITKDNPTVTLFGVWEANGGTTPPDDPTNPNPPAGDKWSVNATYNPNIPDNTTVQPKNEVIAVTGTTGVIKAPANTFTRDGYTFSSWNTRQDGTGSSYAPGNDITVSKDNPNVVLYAIWTQNPVTWEARLIYSVNGGTGSINTDTYQETQSTHTFTVKKPEGIARDGYVFTGWNTKADGTGTNYTQDATIVVTKEAPSNELFAQWRQVKKWTATIKYNANGGTGAIPDTIQTITDKEKETITISGTQNMQKQGSTFLYWNTKADGSGTKYSPNTTWEATEKAPTLELFAIWSQVQPWTATIKYNANGGTGTVADTTVNVTDNDKAEVTISTNTMSRQGYTFKCWNTQADGKGTSYNQSAKVTIYTAQPTLQLYAIWQDANGNIAGAATTGSGNNAGTNGTTGQNPAPKTSDDFNLMLHAILMLFSLIGMGGVLATKIILPEMKHA